ncbi:helix-turn-helix transcriptional regulator [Lactobacillus paragasseri]|uniref:helix-turn-helix transcriptional regulator n=1 Tax=Lactobacillus paragasseri TaxID=2107999 RepID=UPI00217ED987|nr:helix-turn-helix transcriptional regulator [Lactobacillus paragasseri]UWI43856.1 helix-turn-helix transcriptional regulator [Lactobacillus paragasseri]UWI45100.1 helix-turn-helix transcriptional regulator [Lactobacillus paragasseri]
MNNKKLNHNRIKELRLQYKKTQRDLAKYLNVSEQAIAYYEQGKREPKLETWNKLAMFFQVPTSYLMGLSNDINGWDEWAKATGYSVEQIKDEIKRLIDTDRLDASSDVQHQISQAVKSLDGASYSTTQGAQREIVFQLTRLIGNVHSAFLEPPRKKDGLKLQPFKVRKDMDEQAYKKILETLTNAKDEIGRIAINQRYL